MANDTFGALAHPLRREIVERLSSSSVWDAPNTKLKSVPSDETHGKLQPIRRL